MRKALSIMLAISLCFMCVCVFSPAAYAQEARAMPVPFIYEDTIRISPNLNDLIPPGTARIDITITGQYDAQGDHVYSIESAEYRLRNSVNFEMDDVEIEVWTESTERGYVFYQLVGTLTFSWTDPVFGFQFESVYYGSPVYSFRAYDYME